MIHIALEEFLRSGEFGPIQLGMSRAEFAAHVGLTAQQFAEMENRLGRRGGIWVEGNLEFHYPGDRDALGVIYSDEFTQLDGGPLIDLDPWVVVGGLSRREMCRALDAVEIAYQQVRCSVDDDITIITQGGVKLHFVETDQPHGPPIGLYNISYCAPAYCGPPSGIPLEYELIGQIEHFWDQAGVVGIRLLPEAHLQTGDAIAFHLVTRPDATSMQPDAFAFLEGFVRQVVDEVRITSTVHDARHGGPLATCKTPLTKQQARPGRAVYRILPS